MADRKKTVGRGRGVVQAGGPWYRSRTVEDTTEVRKPKKDENKKEFSLEDEKDAFPPLPSTGDSASPTDNTINEEKIEIACIKDNNSNDNNVGDYKKTDINTNDVLQELTNYTKDLTPRNPKENQTSVGKPIKEFKPKAREPVNTYLARQRMFNLVPRDPEDLDQESLGPGVATTSPDREAPQAMSVLSPFAPEFVPRAMQNIIMNPAATDFVPATNDLSEHKESDNRDWVNLIEDVEDSICFFYQKISESPGLFDELMTIIMPTFSSYLKNPELVSKIITDLYTLSITDCSFAYHAVRMLIYLVGVSTQEFELSAIRSCLLQIAQRESKSSLEKLEEDNVDCNTVIPFLFFLSELYIQLETNGRLLLIGEMVLIILKKLLSVRSVPIKERLNNTMNIVKLTGTFLDQDNRSALDELLFQVEELLNAERNNLDDHTISTVEGLIQLRNSNWGKSDQEDLNESAIPTALDIVGMPMFDQAQAVFYGPDGQVMPYEEQMFLECNVTSGLSSEDQSEPSPGSMDGEMEEAYVEFLQTIPQALPVQMSNTERVPAVIEHEPHGSTANLTLQPNTV